MIPAKSVRAVQPVQPAEQAALLAPTGFWQARSPTVGYARGTRFASKPELIEGFAQGGLTNSIASCKTGSRKKPTLVNPQPPGCPRGTKK